MPVKKLKRCQSCRREIRIPANPTVDGRPVETMRLTCICGESVKWRKQVEAKEIHETVKV